MTEDATSELPQQATVRDHVLYSTKCLLKSQLKRCALVRPQVYARLCEYKEGEEEEIISNLDRLPRFRFGGNRTSTSKVRDFEKRANEQRLRELTERLKRGPVPPPRTRHPNKTPPTSPPVIEPVKPSEVATVRHAPLRSASFSQVDYCADDKKYVRRRLPLQETDEVFVNRAIATLPRSKNLQRCTVHFRSQLPQINQQETASLASQSTKIPNKSFEPVKSSNEEEVSIVYEKEATSSPTDKGNFIAPTPNTQEKKRDKSRRRKGIYISQWPNAYHPTESIIPQFVEEGNFVSCSEESSNNFKDSITEDTGDFPIWSSPQEEPLSPEENNTAPEWPRSQLPSCSPDEKDSLKISTRSVHLLRSDSLSEGEPEIGKLDQLSLIPSDVSDCESRLSVGNDSLSGTPKRYSKRPLRGPYGQMLEAEMKKPESGRKQLNSDLKFLEDLSKSRHSRSRSSCNSSIDESHQKDSLLSSPKQTVPLSKRKISAGSLVVENDQTLVVSHQRTTSSPSKLEGLANTEVSQKLLEQLLRGSSELAASDANLQQKNVSYLRQIFN